jgi:hypothetical protein
MASGSLILATTTSVVVWFSDSSGVPAAGSAAEAARRIMEINLLSMVGMLLFVAATIALLYGIEGRRASA